VKITFIMPSVGRKKGQPYVKTWQMEPLAIAVLASLTPAGHELRFFDDRLEPVDYDHRPDLVAINVETYTARRAYQIAHRFRAAGARVVMGGFHATLCPNEVMEHADAVVTGSAEPVWRTVLEDCQAGRLQRQYEGRTAFASELPDRSIYGTKRYTRITLVETGRGCRFSCEFCSICSFFNRRWTPRPVEDVVEEIRRTHGTLYFFIDDNLGADRAHFRKLLLALEGTGIRWVGQMSNDIARDEGLLDLMESSGCIGVLIGFESLEAQNLEQMNKRVNRGREEYEAAVAALRWRSIAVYATFLFGYDTDTAESFERTLAFAIRQRFFFTAFNHLVPFPGTPLYERLKASGLLLFDRWWLEPSYRFGDIAFRPSRLSPAELSAACLAFRKRFYSLPSLVKRGLDFRANASDPLKFFLFWTQGLVGRRDIELRQGLPLGNQDEEEAV
jgi:radical SAM superfamily enzyme YgiQ (UPF0313 family)